MNSKVKDGGSAFPHPHQHGFKPSEDGMSLRDWFAGTVLGGVIAATKSDTREPNETHEQMFARRAYALADAMLSARQQKDENDGR
jgi:hypothetical protein